MTKKGFTLIEILVVIVIIALLAITASNFDFNSKTEIEKRDSFIGKISSLIHSTLLNTSSGKGIKIGGTIMNPTSTHIRFSPNSIGVYYYSGTTISTGEVMNNPFFGETGYTLTGIYWKNKYLTNTGFINSPVDIIFTNDNTITFSGSDSQTGVIIGMSAGFHNSMKTLEFDRRFGKITIINP